MDVIRNCAKAIIIRDRQILSVKYADAGGEYYALPGGGQMHGEALPQTLQRECREERGVDVRNCGLRFIREYIGKHSESSWRDSRVHQVEYLFECELRPGEDPRGGVHQDHSQVDLVWLPIDGISAFRFFPRMLARYLDRPFPEQIEYWGAVD
jgi:8-oxo-dGTP diphosphatase